MLEALQESWLLYEQAADKRKTQEMHASYPDREWKIYYSSIQEYCYDFKIRHRDLNAFAREFPDLRVLDLAAGTHTVRDFYKKLNRQGFGLAVGSEDIRTTEETIEDNRMNIQCLPADLRRYQTWELINGYSMGQGYHIIFARPVGGWYYCPKKADMMELYEGAVWSLLAPGGRAFLQLPSQVEMEVAGIDVEKSLNVLRQFDPDLKYIPATIVANRLIPSSILEFKKAAPTATLPGIIRQ